MYDLVFVPTLMKNPGRSASRTSVCPFATKGRAATARSLNAIRFCILERC